MSVAAPAFVRSPFDQSARKADAAGLGLGGNESYPDLFQPFGGFPDPVRVEDGHVTLTEAPGIGFEEKSDLIAVLRTI